MTRSTKEGRVGIANEGAVALVRWSIAVLATALLTSSGWSQSPSFSGPLPYQGIQDSPYFSSGQGCYALETFPDGTISVQGLSITPNGAAIVPGVGVPPGGFVLQASALGVIQMNFAPDASTGQYPTQVGFIWTGGGTPAIGAQLTVTVISGGSQAVSQQYTNLPYNDPANPADNTFFGVTWSTGVQQVRLAFSPFAPTISNQIDHVQFVSLAKASDSDGDGTADCIDGCPSDPLKTSPGTCGCFVPETDSDGDGVPDCVDPCLDDGAFASPPQVPFASGHPLVHSFVDLPAPLTDGELIVDVRADLGSFSEFVTVFVEGQSIGLLFTLTGEDCPQAGQEETISIPKAILAAAIDGGSVEVELVPSGLVGTADCPSSRARVRLSYGFSFADCDDNGVDDFCDVAEGAASDCNDNHLPDACDLASGVLADCDEDGLPDLCEIQSDPSIDKNDDGVIDACSYALGDFDLDGIIGGIDLAYLLSIWGVVNPPIGDLTADGLVEGADLSVLLARWGASVP